MSFRIIGGGRAAAALSAALWAIAAAWPAHAGSFRVDPVNISIDEGKAATELRLTNMESKPVGIRVTALRWTQKDGEDVYEATDDVIASPPIFTVAAGATQLVRFGLRRRTAGAAYRIQIEEIPQAASPGTGIRVALKIDLPMYLGSPKSTPASLSWSLRRTPDGTMVAEARNSGGTQAQVSDVRVLDAAAHPIARSSARGVVLPGSMRAWKLGSVTDEGATLMVTTPAGEQQIRVGGARR